MDQGLIERDARERDEFAVLWKGLANHFRDRPIRAHLAAWMGIAIAMGLLMCPDFQGHNLVGFTISGVLCCAILGLLTWPLSDDYRITLVGALIGWMLLSPLVATVSGDYAREELLEVVGLIAGSLFGASGLIWLTPLRWLARTFRSRFSAETSAR